MQLRMLLDLAQNQGDGYVSLKDIAQRQEVSKKYLEQIVPLLNKSNLLRTNRGYQGGYRLAKDPGDYTVGEILRITEGDLAPVACLQSGEVDCPRGRAVSHHLRLGRAVSRDKPLSGQHHLTGYLGQRSGQRRRLLHLTTKAIPHKSHTTGTTLRYGFFH